MGINATRDMKTKRTWTYRYIGTAANPRKVVKSSWSGKEGQKRIWRSHDVHQHVCLGSFARHSLGSHLFSTTLPRRTDSRTA
jgi:hypothetical protein